MSTPINDSNKCFPAYNTYKPYSENIFMDFNAFKYKQQSRLNKFSTFTPIIKNSTLSRQNTKNVVQALVEHKLNHGNLNHINLQNLPEAQALMMKYRFTSVSELDEWLDFFWMK